MPFDDILVYFIYKNKIKNMESKGGGRKLSENKPPGKGGCCGGKKKNPKYERDQVFKMGGAAG